jgi:hypothetical protein
VDNSRLLCMHRVRVALSQVKGLVMGAARRRNPQHFHRVCTGSVRLRTNRPHGCAQVTGRQSSYRAGRWPRINSPVLACQGLHAGREDLAWMRSPETAGTGMLAAARRPGARIHRKPPDLRTLIGPGPRILDMFKPPGLCHWSRPRLANRCCSRSPTKPAPSRAATLATRSIAAARDAKPATSMAVLRIWALKRRHHRCLTGQNQTRPLHV